MDRGFIDDIDKNSYIDMDKLFLQMTWTKEFHRYGYMNLIYETDYEILEITWKKESHR